MGMGDAGEPPMKKGAKMGNAPLASCRRSYRVEMWDTDASGRIHFTAAFRWAEITEHALLRSLGVQDIAQLPRVAVAASYLAPLKLGDELDLTLNLVRMGRSSLTFEWHCTHNGVTCVEGHHTAVFVDGNGTSTPLPTLTFRPFRAHA
jgi:acyl-CoA thioester hydrolase